MTKACHHSHYDINLSSNLDLLQTEKKETEKQGRECVNILCMVKTIMTYEKKKTVLHEYAFHIDLCMSVHLFCSFVIDLQ